MVAIPIISIIGKGLGILGRLGKGKATIAGVAAIAAATAAQAGVESVGLTESIEAATQFVLALVQLIGAVVTAFGVGRKAMERSLKEAIGVV